MAFSTFKVKPGTEEPECTIIVGSGAFDQIPSFIPSSISQAILTADEIVDELYGERAAALLGSRLPVLRIVFPSGESTKTRAVKEMIEDKMLENEIGRDTLMVGLGGGVTMDLAGFCASTYYRGIPSLLLPTSLLAMIDAAIGGKTGVNTRAGKNLVGAFHHPLAVIVDVDCLETLPEKETLNGLAEMAKAGIVANRSLFLSLAQEGFHPTVDPLHTAEILGKAIAVKSDAVAQDARDHSRRQILNFGHTVGHALERLSDYTIPHGAAVSAGMVVESFLAEEAGILPEKEGNLLREGLGAMGLKPSFEWAKSEWPEPVSKVMEAMKKDKKNRRGEIRFSLPEAVGTMAAGKDGSFTVRLEPALVRSVLEKRL